MRAASRSHPLRDRFEASLLNLFIALIRVLPMRASVRFGEWLGGAIARVDRGRREVALSNLELAYGAALTAPERAAVVRAVYRHLGRFLFEYLLLLTHRDLRPLSRFLEFENLDLARATVAEHGAAIFVTLHQGHWELLGGAFSELVTPLHAVMTPMRNPRLNAIVRSLRADLGIKLIQRDQAVPHLFRHLRRGDSVALLCDLNHKEGPDYAEFFGVPAATVRTPGVLAVRTGKPLVCATSWSVGGVLRYRGRFAPPILPRPGADPDAESHRIVVEMNRQLERFVREHPEQWNWIHPRWESRPRPAGPPAAGADGDAPADRGADR